MKEPTLESKFAVLTQISRAQHFAWREAVLRTCPGVDPTDVVLAMWEVTGRQTAEAYARRMDPGQPVPAQVAEGIVWSSLCMGEDAVAEPGAGPDEAYVRHRACPWADWHRKLGLVAEDRPGCDAWFRATADEIGRRLNVQLEVDTLESLPEGGQSCLRRLRVVR